MLANLGPLGWATSIATGRRFHLRSPPELMLKSSRLGLVGIPDDPPPHSSLAWPMN